SPPAQSPPHRIAGRQPRTKPRVRYRAESPLGNISVLTTPARYRPEPKCGSKRRGLLVFLMVPIERPHKKALCHQVVNALVRFCPWAPLPKTTGADAARSHLLRLHY